MATRIFEDLAQKTLTCISRVLRETFCEFSDVLKMYIEIARYLLHVWLSEMFLSFHK